MEKNRYLCEGSITGLTQDNDNFYAITQIKPQLLTISKKTFEVKAENIQVSDPHSLLKTKDGLFMVSTGENSVYKYPDKLFWKSPRSDYQHINSLAYNGNYYVASLYGGYIKNITTGKIVYKKLKHPHSLCIVDNDIYVLESGTGTLYKNRKKVFQDRRGYVRGLAIKGDKAYIGFSRWRDISRSGRTRKEVSALGNWCGIIEYDLKEKHVTNEYEFTNHSEIYAICLN